MTPRGGPPCALSAALGRERRGLRPRRFSSLAGLVRSPCGRSPPFREVKGSCAASGEGGLHRAPGLSGGADAARREGRGLCPRRLFLCIPPPHPQFPWGFPPPPLSPGLAPRWGGIAFLSAAVAAIGRWLAVVYEAGPVQRVPKLATTADIWAAAWRMTSGPRDASRTRFCVHPFGCARLGDALLLIRGRALAADVAFFEKLTTDAIRKIREDYNARIMGKADYWQSRHDCRYCTLIGLKDIRKVPPYRIQTSGMQGWIVLDDGTA